MPYYKDCHKVQHANVRLGDNLSRLQYANADSAMGYFKW